MAGTSKGTVEHSAGTSRVDDTTHVVEAPAAVPGTHAIEHDVDTSQVADTVHAVEDTAESAAAAYELVEPEVPSVPGETTYVEDGYVEAEYVV